MINPPPRRGAGHRKWQTLPNHCSRPDGATELCSHCGQWRVWHNVNPDGRPLFAWSDCECTIAALDHHARILDRVNPSRYHPGGYPSGAGTLEPFMHTPYDPQRCTPPGTARAAIEWIHTAIATGDRAPDYESSPAAAIYLHSPGAGTGKTHLAAYLAGRAIAAGRRVMVIDEIDFFPRYWSTPIEDRAGLLELITMRAWLLVVDDIGRRESRTAAVRDTWHAIIGQRYYQRGWCIFTSNYTPDQLESAGTISDFTSSRLEHYTQHRIVSLGGVDQRAGGVA